jgi:predicted Zn-dependent protease
MEESMQQVGRHVRGHFWVGICAMSLVLLVVSLACETVPVTGRQQLILVSPEEENRLGVAAYREVLKEESLSRDPQETAMVRRVGQRLARVAKRPDFDWEFRLIDKNEANAFALPGGKVAVYTGILKYTQTETGLAVVMGHEVAHALARHGGERMSRTLIAQIGLGAVQEGLGVRNPLVLQGIELAYGIGIGLPFDRSQESEADHIGLILMAKAGYNPREAIQFWERMEAAQGDSGPPEFLPTHPSGETRIAQIREWLPRALRYYRN